MDQELLSKDQIEEDNNIDRDLLSTKKVAEKLGVTVTTVYQYVKQRKLKPVYDDWSIDETMLFYPSDVQAIIEKRPSGYTTSQAAKKLGVHQTTIAKQIKEGKIEAHKEKYRGKLTYFIKEETLTQMLQSYGKKIRKKTKFYQPDYKLYLYQSLVNEKTNELARVNSITKDGGSIITDSGEEIALSNINMKGYSPLERFPNKNYLNRAGYVHFRFDEPKSLHSRTYKILEIMYRSLSHKNMNLSVLDGYIEVRVKPVILKGSSDYFSLLEENLISGRITERHNGLLLDSGLESIQLNIPSEKKKLLEAAAKSKGLSLKEYLEDQINNL